MFEDASCVSNKSNCLITDDSNSVNEDDETVKSKKHIHFYLREMMLEMLQIKVIRTIVITGNYFPQLN